MRELVPGNDWWIEPDEDTDLEQIASDVVANYRFLAQKQTMRRLKTVLLRDVYEGLGEPAANPWDQMQYDLKRGRLPLGKLGFHRSVIDSLKSYVGNNSPTVRVATTDAAWSSRLRARKLDRYIDARFRDLGVPGHAASAALEALNVGTGALKTHPCDGRVMLEMVPTEELVVDDAQARYGIQNVRELMHRRLVNRDVLAAEFPDHEEQIHDAPAAEVDEILDRWVEEGDRDQLVEVIEAWHLPSGTDAEDGVRIVCIDGHVLLRESYDCPRFPFAFFRYLPKTRSFWGGSLLEQLLPIQADIDRTLDDIRNALRVGTKPKAYVRRGEGISKRQFQNTDPAVVVEHDGARPQIEAPTPVSPQLFQHLDWLIQQMYSLAGISELTSQAKLPAQVGSGRAMENLHDLQTKRFKDLDRRFQELHVDVARLVVDASKQLAESDGPSALAVRWSSGRRSMSLDWGDVELGHDQLNIYLEPQSFFPETRAGRLSAIEQMVAAGQVPQQLIASYLQDPDIERLNRRLNASYNYVEAVIERLEDPDIEVPLVDDHCDLQLTLDLVKAAYLDVLADMGDDVPEREDVQERFVTYLAALVDEVKKIQPAPPQMPPGPAMDPSAAGGVPMN